MRPALRLVQLEARAMDTSAARAPTVHEGYPHVGDDELIEADGAHLAEETRGDRDRARERDEAAGAARTSSGESSAGLTYRKRERSDTARCPSPSTAPAMTTHRDMPTTCMTTSATQVAPSTAANAAASSPSSPESVPLMAKAPSWSSALNRSAGGSWTGSGFCANSLARSGAGISKRTTVPRARPARRWAV